VTAETLRVLGIMTQPVIPTCAGKLLDLLAVPQDKRAFVHATAAGALEAETVLPAPAPIFPRYIEAEEAKD
jgi:methionyl-tRNA synthetase